jgi:hypothetical protein
MRAGIPIKAWSLLLLLFLVFTVAQLPAGEWDSDPLFTRWPFPSNAMIYRMIGGASTAAEARAALRGYLQEHYFDKYAVLALGCVGDQSDIPFLQSLAPPHDKPLPDIRFSNDRDAQLIESTILWATARLGDKDAQKAVNERLIAPAPVQPNFGHVNRWLRFGDEVRMTVYVGHPSVAPALIKCLDDVQKPPHFECFIFFNPALTTTHTLQKMIPRAAQPPNPHSAGAWVEWLEKQQPARPIPGR